MHYVTYASDTNNHRLNTLKRSAALAGVSLTVVGNGIPWVSFQDKLLGYHKFLTEGSLEHGVDIGDNDVVLLVRTVCL